MLAEAGRKLGLLLAPAVIAGMVAGCVTSNPDTAKVAAAPKTSPMRNITSFSEALKCMDDLFLQYGKRDIYITTAGIPDATGKVAAGTKEMLISALNNTAKRSKAFKYIDYDTEKSDLNALFSDMLNAGQSFTPPSYYIRGAITQLDENALDEQAGASIALPWGDLGFTKDQVVSLVSVDMNVGHVASRTILPGVNASNTIAVVKKGTGADAGGAIQKMGLQFSVNMNRSEGLHQAVRVLIELGIIETLGKLTETPYWQCLQADKTNPQVMAQARDWYDGMAEKDQVTFAQTRLGALGYYRGPVTGVLDRNTADAIAKYQAENNVIADGRFSFDTYYSMLDVKGGQPMPAGAAIAAPVAAPPMAAQPPSAAAPVSMALETDRGARPVYRVNDKLNASIRVSPDAFVYCYYKDADNVIARVFPNRFTPDAYVTANKPVTIVSRESKKFGIRFDRAATEQLACFASPRDIGSRLPEAYKIEDLRPLPTRSLDDVAGAFRAVDNGVSQTVMPITIQ